MKRKLQRFLAIDSLEQRCLLTTGPFEIHELGSPDSQPDFSSPADLDDDGDLDLVVSSWSSGKIIWYENDGSGRFGDAQRLVEQPNILRGSVAIGDLTGDGRLDIVWSSYVDSFGIYWIRGLEEPGTFSEPAEITFGTGKLKLADLDNDDDLDIVIGSGRAAMRWLENTDGEGAFESRLIEFGEGNRMSIADAVVGDIDADSDLDIVIQEGSQIAWLQNDGQAGFTFQWVAQGQRLVARTVSLFDVTGDGTLDILTENGVREMAAYEFQQDSGSFSEARQVLADGRVMILRSAAFDHDGDSDVDLVIGFDAGGGFDGLSYFENVGDSSYVHRGVIADELRAVDSLSPGDFNGDGLADLVVVARENNQVFMLEGQASDNRFGELQAISSQNVGAQHVAVGDLNGDSLPDVVLVSHAETVVSWRRNLGQGQFDAPIRMLDGIFRITDVTVADPDSDGDQDVVVAALNGISWIENADGDGGIGQLHSIGIAAWSTLLPADFDKDGDMDFIGYDNVNDAEIYVYENTDGRGQFTTQLLAVGGRTGDFPSVTLADVDHDGDLDIVAVHDQLRTIGVIWFENEDGTFATEQQLNVSLTTSTTDAQLIDVDGDGDLDLMASSLRDGILFWYERSPSGQFVQSARRLPRIAQVNSQIDVVDLDQDGDEDVLLWANECRLFCETSGIQWLRNDGNATFVLTTLLPQEPVHGWNPIVHDLDRDGDLDIIAASEETDEILWFRNEERIVGDVNNDGVFDSSDLAVVFQAGLFEQPEQVGTSFEEGDWNDDGQFTTADLVYAFQRGGFQA